MNEIKRSGQFVAPGDKLGVIEEFIASSGTYVKDDKVFAKLVGQVLLDLMNKKVSVYPLTRNVIVPKVGNIITGDVVNVQETSSIIRIFKIGGKPVSGFFSGIIHISDVSFSYVNSMFDAFRLGDILKAKVISEKNGAYHLSTKGQNLGVIYAFCSSCGGILSRKKNKLVCERCGNTEKRKMSSEYGRGPL